MALLFLSHSSTDNAEAIALRDWLVAEGWSDLFLDIDPTRGIVAGERWERALHDAASRCDAVLFLVSRAWLASDWCRRELHLAHKLNKRILVLLIADIPIAELPSELTATWQVVNLAAGADHQLFRTVLPDGCETHVSFSTSGLTRLRTGLTKAGLDPSSFAWPPETDRQRPPYRGLLPLEAEDAGIFFGREAPTIELLAQLRGLREAPPPRFVAVLGASGAGKSSFLRAGILPRLERDDRQFLPLPVVRPERAVLSGEKNGLLRCLEQALACRSLPITRPELRRALESDGADLLALLARLAEAARLPALPGEAEMPPPTLVLPIDQGEELFMAEGAAEAERFLGLLGRLLTAPKPDLLVLVTIRSDRYESLQTAKALEGVRQIPFPLAPMPRGTYKAVIEGPAARLGGSDRPLRLHPGLTDALLRGIEQGGGKDVLPLLAFTLERLYLDYHGSGELRPEHYAEMGGIQGAIDAAVAQAFARADLDARIPRDRAAREALLRRGLIPWLAGIDPDSGSPRRRVARLSEIPVEARPLIGHLVEARLLATDIDQESGEATIEPAHEALLRQWGVLSGWLEEDLAALSALEGVRRATRDWLANDGTGDWLAHRAGRLEDAEGLRVRDDLSSLLGAEEWAYLAACRQHEEAQRNRELEAARRLAAEQRKAARRLGSGLAAAMVLTFVAGIGGFLAWEQKSVADQQRLVAEEQNLRFVAQTAVGKVRGGDPELGGLLVRAILSEQYKRYSQPTMAEAAQVLAEAVGRDRVTAAWVPSGWVNMVEYAPSGETVAVATREGAAVYDPRTGRKLAALTDFRYPVTQSLFLKDGQHLLLGSAEGEVRLWNWQNGHEEVRYGGFQEGKLLKVAVSSDNTLVAVGSDDGLARVFAIDGKIAAELNGHDGKVTSIGFHPSGGIVLTSSEDGTARLWDARSGEEVAVLAGQKPINAALFSPDGNIIATAERGAVRLWDGHGQLLEVLEADDFAPALAFDAASRLLAFSAPQESVGLWDLTAGRLTATIRASGRRYRFSQDGNSLLLADDKIRVLDLVSYQQAFEIDGDVFALRPDGSQVTVGNNSKSIKAVGLRPRFGIPMSNEPAREVRFSAGRLLQIRWHGVSLMEGVAGPEHAITLPDSAGVIGWDGYPSVESRTGQVIVATDTRISPLHHGWLYSANMTSRDVKKITIPGDLPVRISSVSLDGASIAIVSAQKAGSVYYHTALSPEWHRIDGSAGVHRAKMSPSGNTIALFMPDGATILWDVKGHRQLVRLPRDGKGFDGHQFSTDGRYLFVTGWNTDKTTQTGVMLDTREGEILWQETAMRNGGVNFSPGSHERSILVKGQAVEIRETRSGRRVLTMPLEDEIWSADFITDDEFIAIYKRRPPTIYSVHDSKASLLFILRGEARYPGVSVEETRRLLSTEHAGGTMVWDWRNGHPVAFIQSGELARYSPWGLLWSHKTDGIGWLWDVSAFSSLPDLLDYYEATRLRALTVDEQIKMGFLSTAMSSKISDASEGSGAEQLRLGDAAEAAGNLKAAFFYYAVASRLIRGDQQLEVLLHKGSLARALPASDTLTVWRKAKSWRPGETFE